MRARLTDTLAATLAPPASGKSHLIVWDTHPKAPTGFGLRITAAGARSYILNYRRRSDGTEIVERHLDETWDLRLIESLPLRLAGS